MLMHLDLTDLDADKQGVSGGVCPACEQGSSMCAHYVGTILEVSKYPLGETPPAFKSPARRADWRLSSLGHDSVPPYHRSALCPLSAILCAKRSPPSLPPPCSLSATMSALLPLYLGHFLIAFPHSSYYMYYILFKHLITWLIWWYIVCYSADHCRCRRPAGI